MIARKCKTTKPQVKPKPDIPPDGYKKSLISGIFSVPPGEQLVKDLRKFSGDVTRLLLALHPTDTLEAHRDRKSVLVCIVLELGKPENTEHKAAWFQMEVAHKQAQVLLLENEMLTAIGGGSGRTREERELDLDRIFPPNFKMVDLKYFLSAFLPERYAAINYMTRPSKTAKVNRIVPEPEEMDASMRNVLDVLGDDDCQEAEDLDTRPT
jgi:hypothetical protein